jgi:signal transduction histidine kinase
MKKQAIGWKLIRFSFSMLRKLLKLALLIVGGGVLLSKRHEERTKNQAMRDAQSRMNEFLNIASHELKTPLTSIKGNVQLVGRRLKASGGNESEDTRRLLAEARELLDRTDQQISRLTRLVNGLLETARISGNTMDLLFELCELNQLLQEATQNGHHLPKERALQLQIPEDKTLLVMADPTRIKQVVVHFLSNAHKFSPLEKPIEIHLSEDGHMAKISVRDEGAGVASEEQKNVWERFYRVPGTEVLNGSEVGLGLGLHISRSIIEQHHGQTGLQSSPGQGSTFWFSLPITDTKSLF